MTTISIGNSQQISRDYFEDVRELCQFLWEKFPENFGKIIDEADDIKSLEDCNLRLLSEDEITPEIRAKADKAWKTDRRDFICI